MPAPSTRRPTHVARQALLVAMCLLLVAPPVHWLVGGGDRLLSIGYFIGGGVLVVAALALIARHGSADRET